MGSRRRRRRVSRPRPLRNRARAERAQARLFARRRAGAAAGFKPDRLPLRSAPRRLLSARVLQKLDDDESAAPAPSLSDNQSSARAATDDDAKKRDRAIAEAIPTDADQLFKATVDWAAFLPVSYLYLYVSCYVGGARGRRPGQVTDRGSPKNRRVSGGRRTHADQLRLFLLRAEGPNQKKSATSSHWSWTKTRRPWSSSCGACYVPRGEGGAAPLSREKYFCWRFFHLPFPAFLLAGPRRRRRRVRARRRCARWLANLTLASRPGFGQLSATVRSATSIRPLLEWRRKSRAPRSLYGDAQSNMLGPMLLTARWHCSLLVPYMPLASSSSFRDASERLHELDAREQLLA